MIHYTKVEVPVTGSKMKGMIGGLACQLFYKHNLGSGSYGYYF